VGRNRGGGPQIEKYTMKVLSLGKREHFRFRVLGIVQTLEVSESTWVNGFGRFMSWLGLSNAGGDFQSLAVR
jgi:hypothetical protein